MATTKTKRSIHLAQPQPQDTRRSPNRLTATEPMPVKAHVYYEIAEMNAGLEKAIHNLQLLQSNQLFRASGLTGMNRDLRGIRARANRQLMTTVNDREAANAGHFQKLGLEVSE